jgi:hypothetical protein
MKATIAAWVGRGPSNHGAKAACVLSLSMGKARANSERRTARARVPRRPSRQRRPSMLASRRALRTMGFEAVERLDAQRFVM